MVTPFIEGLRSQKSPWDIFQALYPTSRVCFFLDSGDYRPPAQNYSYLGADPFLQVTITGEKLRLWGEETGEYPAAEIFPVLRRIFRKYRRDPKPSRPFFAGGAVGYWGYEIAPLFDKVSFRKKPGPASPRLHLAFFRDLIVYDHAAAKYFLIVHRRTPSDRTAKDGAARLKSYFERPRARTGFYFSHFRPEISRARFESMIRKAKDYIAAGDIYQANLSQRFSFQCKGSALRLYETLRTINPSPFSSFLRFGGLQIISSSPERLIRRRGRECETRPIAGTRPRRAPRRDTEDLERELLQSEKERAEHIMLVDLERSDLGRVCETKSVKVEEMMTIEKYSHVLHIVSQITGRLARGRDSFDLIRAMFPGGTITGCPKIRCMQIIDELEPVRRGIYTGSVGYLDFSGDLDLNLVIRTLVLEKDQGTFQVGAGIVHDSDPAKEYEETLHKGEALAEALVQASL